MINGRGRLDETRSRPTQTVSRNREREEGPYKGSEDTSQKEKRRYYEVKEKWRKKRNKTNEINKE